MNNYRLFMPLLIITISAIALFAVLRTPPPWTLDMGTAGDERFSTRFSVHETNNTTTFRWSMKESRLLLHGTHTAQYALAIRLYGDERAHTHSWYLRLHQGNNHTPPFANLPVTYGWRVYHIILPSSATTNAHLEVSPLTLTSTIYRTSPEDHRNLGVPIDWIHLSPLDSIPTNPSIPLRQALVYVWSLGTLYALLWRIDRTILPHRTPFAPIRVSIPIGAIAIILILWAHRNPYTLAWALPPLPWITALTMLVLALTANGRPKTNEESPKTEAPRPRSPVPGLLLLMIFLLALALRTHHLANIPYGLWRDEARHGLIALTMLEDPTYRPIYIAAGGVNMPALGLYPFALALHLWGIHDWSLRAITAIAGALTVFPLYALVIRMTGRTNIALLSAAFLAVSSWHITISRFSFPTIFDPLLTLTGLWLFLVAIGNNASSRKQGEANQTKHLLAAIASGACLGLAAQNYHTGRVVPLVVGILAVLLLIYKQQHWQRWLTSILAIGIGFTLTTAPLLLYALNHPSAFNTRVSRVFILSENALHGQAPLTALDQSIGRHALMFNWRGDSNGRHHAPEKPLLDPITGLGFLAGCIVILRRWNTWQHLFIMGALAIGLIPSLLAVEGPHAMRSISAASFAYIIAAIGWIKLLEKVGIGLPRRQEHQGLNKQGGDIRQRFGLPPETALIIVLLATACNYWTYFVAMPVERRVWTANYPIHTQVGTYVRTLANKQGPQTLTNVYIQSSLTDNSVFDYLAYDLPIATFDGPTLSHPPSPGAQFVYSGYVGSDKAQELSDYLGPNPQPVLLGPLLPDGKRASFKVYHMQP